MYCLYIGKCQSSRDVKDCKGDLKKKEKALGATDCVTGGVNWAAASIGGAWLASWEGTKGNADLPLLDSEVWRHDYIRVGRCTGTVSSSWPPRAAAVMH